MRLSVITPAFNEADNLEPMYQQLATVMAGVGVEWDWVIVDDHSQDATFDVTRALAGRDARVRGLRLARNSGAHTAITCGLHHAEGDAAVVLAADLQDPPAVLSALLARWREGAQVVWAVRREGPGRSAPRLGFSRLYYWIMRHVVGMKQMPATGADFFLVDRIVIDAFNRFRERHVSVLALITWMGFRQAHVEYDKQPRQRGQSGWTLSKKLTLVADSVTGFSSVPLRLCTYGGVLLLAFGAAAAVAGVALLPRAGSELLVLLAAVVGLGGAQLLALGLLGAYVWRALDEARRRPPYLIEAIAGVTPDLPAHRP